VFVLRRNLMAGICGSDPSYHPDEEDLSLGIPENDQKGRAA